ncbi:uncharacterized protein M6B38_376750 [Iris pallida]|uniref:Uncharacterized protein n=1 Tax=Iris pallida TaxID=29817 RepID=A0AAX6GA76_IRIPA|nr:uncharacterized protein M6B38_376750 [Iris pallida]
MREWGQSMQSKKGNFLNDSEKHFLATGDGGNFSSTWLCVCVFSPPIWVGMVGSYC